MNDPTLSLQEQFDHVMRLMDAGRLAEANKLVSSIIPFSYENDVFLQYLGRFLFELGFVDESDSIMTFYTKRKKHVEMTASTVSGKITQFGTEWNIPSKSEIYDNPSWELRAKYISRILNNPKKVLDLGCANMLLEKHLPADTIYIPCDIQKRGERCLVCDFDHDELPEVNDVSHVVCLGVINYLDNADHFLRQLPKYGAELILVFKPCDLPSFDQGNRALKYYPKSQDIIDILQDVGFKCGVKRISGGYAELMIRAHL